MCSKLGSWSFPGKHSKLRKRISLPHEPPAGCVVSWAPTLLDSELIELPGQPWLWVSMAWEGAGAGSGNVEVAFVQDMHRGTKSPKCWALLACGDNLGVSCVLASRSP